MEDRLLDLFSKGFEPEREDPRAFGAMIEKHIVDHWNSICAGVGAEPKPTPGRRTIFDASCKFDNKFIGLDVKTKDIDQSKFSDGGVCAVKNLLRFLSEPQNIFLVAELSHASHLVGTRTITSATVIPLQCLPASIFRIENLGTGQIRFNFPLSHVQQIVNWGRSMAEFMEFFSDIVECHYERVQKRAAYRANVMCIFRSNGFKGSLNL